MDGHPQEIECQDDPRQRRADTPEDVADNERPQLVFRIGYGARDEATGRRGDHDGYDGDEV